MLGVVVDRVLMVVSVMVNDTNAVRIDVIVDIVVVVVAGNVIVVVAVLLVATVAAVVAVVIVVMVVRVDALWIWSCLASWPLWCVSLHEV